ncbi:MAG: tetratricopeptide repeat protein [Armatimonadota bacterium]|nr:hypothetical protein [bacterium]
MIKAQLCLKEKFPAVLLVALLLVIFCNAVLAVQATNDDMQQAVKAMQEKKFKRAISILESLVAKDGVTDIELLSNAHFILGFAYEQDGNINKAQKEYQITAVRYPNTEGGKCAKEQLARFAANKASESGIAGIEKALADAKDESNAKKIAIRLINTNRSPDSIKLAQHAFEVYAKRFGYVNTTKEVMYELVLAYESAGKYPTSYSLLKKLFERFPNAKENPEYLTQMGYYANLLGRSSEALQNFDMAILLKPSKKLYAKALMGKAVSFRNQGKPNEGMQALAQSKKLAEEMGDTRRIESVNLLVKKGGFTDEHQSKAKGRNVWLVSCVLAALVAAAVGIRVTMRLRKRRR